jgi:predicted MPP superfamily phosphohydrolase
LSRFLFIVFGLFSTSFVWWWWADTWLRSVKSCRWWRIAVAAYALLHAGLFVLLIFSRTIAADLSIPSPMIVAVYLWHLLIMPGVLIAVFGRSAYVTLRETARSVWRTVTAQPQAVTAEPAPELANPAAPVVVPTGPTRRQILGAALVVATPPVAEIAAVATAIARLDEFRIRDINIAYRNLPPALDGAVIAHLSDTHLGRFTTRRDVARIVDTTNNLGADAVAFTGDLIDFDLTELPNGLELLRGIKSPVVVCEGNHDLFQDRLAFENGLKQAGFPLLLNESHIVSVRGYPMQFLGLKWGDRFSPRNSMLGDSLYQTMPQVDKSRFAVLLAHHPHAFDAAANSGIKLTLAGHTHGGQVMLTPNLGPGPLMYKYWSGLYRNDAQNAACVVSNGIGNWFPLRINAPAEIVRITLRQA